MYGTNAGRVKYNLSNKASWWWLRSADKGTSDSFCAVGSNGSGKSYGDAKTSYGISPVFRIGNSA